MTVAVNNEQLLAMLPALADKKLHRAAIRAGLIIAAASASSGDWVVCSQSALAMVADLIDAGVFRSRCHRVARRDARCP